MATATQSTNGSFSSPLTAATIAFPPPALPRLPVLLSTALALELVTGAPTIDLRAASAILLRDPFATLEAFRRASEECGIIFARVEDCLASLPVEAWPGVYGELPGDDFPCSEEAALDQLADFAAHAREIAERCRALAEAGEAATHSGQSVDCEQAYLAGLLHEAEQLPELLGWPCDEARGRRPGSKLATHSFADWLPPFLHGSIPGLKTTGAGTVKVSVPSTSTSEDWEELLRAAHHAPVPA